ncbi:hypothetical protein ARMGADRAFT_1075044 [Armillaria gallica]|uniref:Nephrocystin 3-like N-terminal domain-containing protein n=1 Tax=Armillaria gallica TaxID=47427 RepID=A0A2H3DSK0_ARMGA|nr:hypothetical protein ARMGADRAFT_1075044 [Armillaria gallica]
MANERGHRMIFIRQAEIVTIAPTEKSKFCLKIAAGSKKQKTDEIKIDEGGTMPKWTINMDLGDLDPQIVVSWKLYGRRRLRLKVLGSVEKTLGELFEGSSTSADIHLSDGTSEIAVLQISGSNSAKTLMDELIPSTKKPSENSKFLESSETLGTVFEAAKGMVDTLAGVHPAATVAWGFLSIGFKVLKNQRDTNQAALDLYAEMISVYEEASKKDILQQRDGLHGTYSSLFKQTIECALFIEGYAKKSGIGRLFTIDISGQAAKFHQAFAGLKDQLTRGFARESVIVTLGVQELVNIQIMMLHLQNLEPPQELRPKSRCMQGTRVATINTMVSWIAQCDGGMMWCKGLAGTGKSSLMGTLHDLLTADIGGRSRLAAFIRYDHIQYSNASKLITSIAYGLGMFDDRIGMAISRVIQTSRSVATMSDPSAQFRLLLRGPLESLPNLVDEGPLVVIVDGLDECDASDDLLAVLAEGFGPKLPFMRLIISSRPVHHITTAFKERDGKCTLHLDTSSKDVDRDIQFYLERQFATVGNPAFQAKCKELGAIERLAARASGLFIWAATVAKFVHAFPATSRLQSLLATDIPGDATEALATLYRTALNTLVSELPGANADVKKYVRNVLGAVLVAETPPGMTEDILDNLVLDEGSPPSHHVVSMLGSVLSPETEDSPIRPIHKSLDDFLQDRSRCGDEWFVDVPLHRRAIAKRCLDASQLFLQKWSPKIDMDIAAIPVYISEYALFGAFWYLNAFDESGLELFDAFFRCYFLPWMDVHLCTRSDDVLPHLSMVLNWSNQFGSTESRTLFYHAYLFAYRALQDGGQSRSGPSHISTSMVSLSPSSNIIRKAWERLNVSDPLPISPDKERLVSRIELGSYFLNPDSDSLITLEPTPKLMTTQWEINTGRQKLSLEIPHTSSFDRRNFISTLWGLSIVVFKRELATRPPPTSDWIMLPLPDHVSQGTIHNPLWLYMAVFDSRTRTLGVYTLFLSHFSPRDFSIALYKNGIVLVHNVGSFMRIAIGQEDNFAWISIPTSNCHGPAPSAKLGRRGQRLRPRVYPDFRANRDLRICRDGSKVIFTHYDNTIQLYDTRTGTALFDPLHIDGWVIGVSDDGSKIVFHNRNPKAIRICDMNLGGKVIAVIDSSAVEFVPISFLGRSKIGYIIHQCLFIQSLVTGDILFRHGIPEPPERGRYWIQATPDGARIITHDDGKCMVWDVGDL